MRSGRAGRTMSWQSTGISCRGDCPELSVERKEAGDICSRDTNAVTQGWKPANVSKAAPNGDGDICHRERTRIPQKRLLTANRAITIGCIVLWNATQCVV